MIVNSLKLGLSMSVLTLFSVSVWAQAVELLPETKPVTAPATKAEKKTEDQFWAEAGITHESMIADWLVDNQNCHANEARFRGCIQALNGLGSRAKPALEVVPEALIGQADVPTGPVHLHLEGGLALVEVSTTVKTDESIRQVQMRSTAKTQRIRSGLQDLFKSLGDSHLDFVAMLKQVLAESKLSPEVEPAAAAQGITLYLIEAVDAHAHLDTKKKVEDSNVNVNRDFVGIGVMVSEASGQMIITRTIEGGPARRSGVKANDVIMAVDGLAIQGSNSKEVVDRIKGTPGTSVTLKLLRKGQEVEVVVPRERVIFENVEVKVKEMTGGKYLSVKLGSFMDSNGCLKIGRRISEAQQANPDLAGLILDFRDNGGGLLEEAICIGGLFVGKKVIVQVKDLNRNGMQQRISYREQATELPMVTLLNGNSASASEVVSGALQDYQRSWIVGERSFGKATVQAPLELSDDVLLYRTIQRFYQPSGRTNQIVGILPDFETPAKPGASEDERYVLREGDLYPNAMSALGEPWKQTRPDEVAAIAQCRAEHQRAEKVVADGDEVDYQMEVAAEVLACEKEIAAAKAVAK